MFLRKAPLLPSKQTDEQYKEVTRFILNEGNALMNRQQQQAVMKAWGKEQDSSVKTQAYLRTNFRHGQPMPEEESKQFQLLLTKWNSNQIKSKLDKHERKLFSRNYFNIPDLLGCYHYLLKAAVRPGDCMMQRFIEEHWALGYYNEALQICQAYIAIELRNKEPAPKSNSFIYQFMCNLVPLAEKAAAEKANKTEEHQPAKETAITNKYPILFALIIYQTFYKEINSKEMHTVTCDLAIKYSYLGFATLAFTQLKMGENKENEKEVKKNVERSEEISKLFKQRGELEQKLFAGSTMSFFVPAEFLKLSQGEAPQEEHAKRVIPG